MCKAKAVRSSWEFVVVGLNFLFCFSPTTWARVAGPSGCSVGVKDCKGFDGTGTDAASTLPLRLCLVLVRPCTTKLDLAFLLIGRRAYYFISFSFQFLGCFRTQIVMELTFLMLVKKTRICVFFLVGLDPWDRSIKKGSNLITPIPEEAAISSWVSGPQRFCSPGPSLHLLITMYYLWAPRATGPGRGSLESPGKLNPGVALPWFHPSPGSSFLGHNFPGASVFPPGASSSLGSLLQIGCASF